jgi:hypothetical protein
VVAAQQDQQVFRTHRGTQIDVWLGTALLLGVSLCIVFLLGRWDGDLGLNPPLGLILGFYGFVAFGAAVPLIIAYSRWRKLPADVLSGSITLDADGITFSVDGRSHRFAWASVSAIHPVRSRRPNVPCALYLAVDGGSPPGLLPTIGMRWRADNRWTSPFETRDGVVIPLKLFRASETPSILHAACVRFAAFKNGGVSPADGDATGASGKFGQDQIHACDQRAVRKAIRRPSDNPAPFVIAFAIAGFAFLAFNPPDRWTAPYPMMGMERRELAYPGEASVTIHAAGLDLASRARIDHVLDGLPHNAAYAEGPDGRTGVWSGAHSITIAREYALAACGEGCEVRGERRPMYVPEGPEDGLLLLLPDTARRIGEEWPFSGSGNALAVGGASAWGTGHALGRNEFRRAALEAMLECEARRVAEPAPEGIEPSPCRYMGLRDAEITDLRPEPQRYPAAYELALANLVVVPEEGLRLVRGNGEMLPGARPSRWPRELYGAEAANGEGARAMIGSGGWPEVAAALAVQLCETRRRFGDPPCRLAMQRMPAEPLPEGTLAVSPELMEAYDAWLETEGAGAFAISAFGLWASSSEAGSLEAARQWAADWCDYYGRRGNGPFNLRRAFIEQPPCRIVAERAPSR